MDLVYKSKIFDLKNLSDESEYLSIMGTKSPIVVDNIVSQIEELLLCRNPLMDLASIRESELVKSVHNGDLHNYGRWAYFPWNNLMVHILAKNEFIEVRSNRNKNKITEEEQKLFSTKTVGIAGLSVGRSAALTLATERIAGKIILADYDSLELSNLNRIKAPITDLGLNKCISTAREIALLDPYLEVECFTEGLTLENMPEFFGGDKKIDLFIEECDSLEIKIKSRLFAKSLGIPVTMEASDRCLVDIERFDLEPDRPILHGILDEQEIENVGSLKTFDEKLKLMSKIVDVNKVSERMLMSLPEIGRSLRTWPQLASDVTFGGDVMTKIVRGIFDNSITASGRYYLDSVEQLKNQN